MAVSLTRPVASRLHARIRTLPGVESGTGIVRCRPKAGRLVRRESIAPAGCRCQNSALSAWLSDPDTVTSSESPPRTYEPSEDGYNQSTHTLARGGVRSTRVKVASDVSTPCPAASYARAVTFSALPRRHWGGITIDTVRVAVVAKCSGKTREIVHAPRTSTVASQIPIGLLTA